MRILFALLLSVMLAVPSFAVSKLNFENYGFSIDTLEYADKDRDEIFQTIMMFLPTGGENFAPNVNVQIQKYAGSAEEYTKLSKDQLNAIGAKVVSEKSGKDSMYIEYTVEVNGMNFHICSKALFDGGNAYLVTGTALISQWAKTGPALKKNVDSFQLNKKSK